MTRGRESKGAGQGATSVPSDFPQVTPPPYSGGSDHSFTLQAVMELTKAAGGLTAEIKGLRADVDKQSERLEKVETKLSGVTHKIYAAGVVLTIVLFLCGAIVNKAWDLLADRLKSEHLLSPAAQTMPQPASEPQAAKP